MSKRTKRAKQTKSAHKHNAAWYPILRLMNSGGVIIHSEIMGSHTYQPRVVLPGANSDNSDPRYPVSKKAVNDLLGAGMIAVEYSNHPALTRYAITDKGRQALKE